MTPIIFVLSLLLVSLFLINCYIFNINEENVKPRILYSPLSILSIIVVAFVVFIRIGFGRYFTTIDESYYLSLLGTSHWYQSSIVSGYVTPLSLHVLYPLFNNPVKEAIVYSVFVSILYLLVLFYIYRLFGLSFANSVLSEVVLFMTPLFMWSMIQIRPQQIGLLVGLFLVAVFISKPPSWRLFLEVLILFTLLIFSHLLSFIMYSLVLIGFITISIILNKSNIEYWYKYKILIGAISLTWIVFLLFPYSHLILKNLTWLFNMTFGTQFSPTLFSMVSSVSILVLLLFWYFVLIHFGSYLRSTLYSIWYLASRRVLYESHPFRKVALFVGVVLVFSGAYLQFRFSSSLYLKIYGESVWALLLFQMGNIVFAILYLRGLFKKLTQGIEDNWVMLSGIMAIIAGVMLLISFFMPSGNGVWGFHNWFIRGLQFFVPLASPVVVDVILDEVATDRSAFMKISVSLLISSLIVVSVLNTARVPYVYNYDATWNPELVDLCPTFHGTYLSREPQGKFSEFVTSNLLKACGDELSKNPSGQLMASSDSFSILERKYSPLSLYDFVNSLKAHGGNAVIIAGGSIPRNIFILSLFPNSRLIPIYHSENCSLDELSKTLPLILVGGPEVNPCSKFISTDIPIKLGTNYVITPNSKYFVPFPSPWWNATQGLFVIYSVKYNGRPVLLVEGTNLDSTLAGIYYFHSYIYSVPSRYQNTHYIVGKWIEKDNNVLSFVKGAPGDNNGFSYGDKIEILEKS